MNTYAEEFILERVFSSEEIFNLGNIDVTQIVKKAWNISFILDKQNKSRNTKRNEIYRFLVFDNGRECNGGGSGTINSHVETVILDDIFQCEKCKSTSTEVNCMSIENKTGKPEVYPLNQCLTCDKSIDTVLVCNICKCAFTSFEQLYAHRKALQHQRRYFETDAHSYAFTCGLCGKKQGDIKLVIKHDDNCENATASKDGGQHRRYLCDLCGKSYLSNGHLWRHKQFHKDTKQHVCTYKGCDKRFAIRWALTDHIRKQHLKVQYYVCTECNKTFFNASSYYKHRLVHQGEGKYGCKQCGRKFFYEDKLINHIRTHTGERPYSCLYCQRSFAQKGNCVTHMRRHTPEQIQAAIHAIGQSQPLVHRRRGKIKKNGSKT